MSKTKKLINAPETVVADMVAGMLGAHRDILQAVGNSGRVIRAKDGPRKGKVGIVIGGGSGHEPAFTGYVGRGLADASAIGNVFSCPPPDPILEAARAVEGGEGILFLYGNYTSDAMNFEMASEKLSEEGIRVCSIPVTDDVSSAPPDRREERRGVAGDFFVFKIAGAAADQMLPLDDVRDIAVKANRLTATMGVALNSCSLPQTRKPNFEIGENEMEIGMGLHGEPGIRRTSLESADDVADLLMEFIQEELQLTSDDRVGVLVNGLGSTTMMELYILFNRLKQSLDEMDVSIHRSFVGEYATSLDMAGASISVIKLDDQMADLLDHPCISVGLTVGTPPAPIDKKDCLPLPSGRKDTTGTAESQAASNHIGQRPGGEITSTIFINMLRAAAIAIEDKADWLSELDGVIGDGGHGITMRLGWHAVRQALEDYPEDQDIEAICNTIAEIFLNSVGSTPGPLYATALRSAAKVAAGREGLDTEATVRFLEAAADGIRFRGKANPGDKTMLDAWWPAAVAARAAFQKGADTTDCLRAAAKGAERGMKQTAEIAARHGRSAKMGERSLGHLDPGAASSFVVIDALRRSFEAQTLDPVESAARPVFTS
ncbi:dihydroxyacetone kinase subunit DhaL [uncultured Cohaesibacter sp.]|uniref:dihydroxyacetone kinase subunit DhaL n=1 Tax=uncultured Cohaesibacter sp. TaxID=1002546 RepID=UPI0029C75065|nr:dihydroxyacetone kinase subunit DhaL [uncultured Cohaesibacter sp.]